MKPTVLWGALMGAVTGLVVDLVSILGNLVAGLPAIPFDIFDYMARALPGQLVNLGRDIIASLTQAMYPGSSAAAAKFAEGAIGVIVFILIGALFGAVLARRRQFNPDGPPVYGLLGGLLLLVILAWIKSSLGFGLAGAGVGILWLGTLLLGWGWSLDTLLSLQRKSDAAPEASRLSRRRFIYIMGNTGLAVVLGIIGLASLLTRSGGQQVAQPTPTPEPRELGPTNGPAASPPNEVLDARFPPIEGTRPELTPTGQFYRIDINIGAPAVDANTWRLFIDGMVNNELALTLDEIQAMPATSQVITLSCISNTIGGDLIGTSYWTGVPLRLVLERAGLQPAAQFLNIRATDGFYESLTVDTAMDERVLLVYSMDGQPLSIDHGFPLRIYIPNLYGMKQPKWITDIEVSNEDRGGYWVARSWSKEAIVRTTSVIDVVSPVSAGTVEVGGIAYSGARGISKVEVQLDEGPWIPAELRVPPLSPLTWVQWRGRITNVAGGLHRVRVRAYDGEGVLQITEEEGNFPKGASGIHVRVFSG